MSYESKSAQMESEFGGRVIQGFVARAVVEWVKTVLAFRGLHSSKLTQEMVEKIGGERLQTLASDMYHDVMVAIHKPSPARATAEKVALAKLAAG